MVSRCYSGWRRSFKNAIYARRPGAFGHGQGCASKAEKGNTFRQVLHWIISTSVHAPRQLSCPKAHPLIGGDSRSKSPAHRLGPSKSPGASLASANVGNFAGYPWRTSIEVQSLNIGKVECLA